MKAQVAAALGILVGALSLQTCRGGVSDILAFIGISDALSVAIVDEGSGRP